VDDLLGSFRWYNALCINQSDQEERSLQVAIMKELYDSADHVFIWLGEEEKGVDRRVRQMLEHISFAYEVVTDALDGRITFQPPSADRIKSYCANYDSADWVALVKFFSHPWFERVWVIQEAAASAPHMVYYGNELVDWSDVCNTSMFFQAASYPSIIPGLDNLIIPTMTHYTRFRSRYSLLDLLHLTAHSKASEPRDKIFALTGLSLEGLELENYPSLKPDYGKSLVVVYADVVRVSGITRRTPKRNPQHNKLQKRVFCTFILLYS
jgi:hypothetical protein